MKLTKQHWTIIGVILAVVAIWYFFLRKKDVKKAESGYAKIDCSKTPCKGDGVPVTVSTPAGQKCGCKGETLSGTGAMTWSVKS